MRPELPLEVLGLLAPILSRVEGRAEFDLPQRGISGALAARGRERTWLQDELPIYSHDTIDDILAVPWTDQERRRPDARRFAHGPASAFQPPEGYDVSQVFRKLCRRYLQWNGNEMCIRAGRMVELHELAARLPLCHVIRAGHARATVKGWLSVRVAGELPDQIGALHSASRSLRVVVERGLCEGHIHLWGVHTVDESWADQLLGDPARTPHRRFSEADGRLLRLGRVAVRLLATAILQSWREPCPDALRPLYHLCEHFDDLRSHGGDPVRERLAADALHRDLEHYISERLTVPAGRGGALFDPDVATLETQHAVLRIMAPYMYQRFYADRALPLDDGNPVRARMRCLELLHLEAQRQFLLLDHAGTSADSAPEHSRLSRANITRDCLHQVFFRYLICHTHHLQRIVQYGQTTGLRDFLSFYHAGQRQLMSSRPEELHANDIALRRVMDMEALHRLEGRVSPPRRRLDELLPWLWTYVRRRKPRTDNKFGLVIHFPKMSQREAEEDFARSKSGGPGACIGRFELYRRGLKAQAVRLFRMLSECHPVVPFIVGIDAASEELYTPPEVFAPVFRFLRDVPIDVRGSTGGSAVFHEGEAAIRRILHHRRLGITYHVGEDFRHLLSGLRAIYEVIEFLDLKPGDRLGHATALALSPEVWGQQLGYQAVLPRDEWLDDLVWMHHFLGAGNDQIGELHVEDRIQYLSWGIYERAHESGGLDEEDGDDERDRFGPSAQAGNHYWSPLILHDAWRLRQLDPNMLLLDRPRSETQARESWFRRDNAIHAEEQRWRDIQRRVWRRLRSEIGSREAFRLLRLHWYDPYVRRRGASLQVVDMADEWPLWSDVLTQVQRKLQKIVRKRQLVVEINPSSNWRIGPMRQLNEHQVFNLTVGSDQKLARSVITTVNSDDPGVFNTSLQHEFYLLGEVLLGRDVPEGDVAEWLDWLRNNGNDYTFLRFIPPLDHNDMKTVLKTIQSSYDRQSHDWGVGAGNVFQRLRDMHPRGAKRAAGARDEEEE